MKRLSLVGSLLAAALFIAAVAAASAPAVPTQGMQGMHEQMMSEMKASDAALDALVKEMNSATGTAKIEAVAAVVTELARQQKVMHERMGMMHDHMMGEMHKPMKDGGLRLR